MVPKEEHKYRTAQHPSADACEEAKPIDHDGEEAENVHKTSCWHLLRLLYDAEDALPTLECCRVSTPASRGRALERVHDVGVGRIGAGILPLLRLPSASGPASFRRNARQGAETGGATG